MAWTDEQKRRHSERMKLAYADTARRAALRVRALAQATGFKVGQEPWNRGVAQWAGRTPPNSGRELSQEEIAARTATRVARHGKYSVRGAWAEGWLKSRSHRAKIGAAFRGKYAGASNPAWRGGVSFLPYPPEFNLALKRRILNEQHRKCFDCRTPIGCRGGKRPNVHHKDGNKSNCQRWNLVALCVSCHTKREWEVTRLLRTREAWKKQPHVVPCATITSLGVERAVI